MAAVPPPLPTARSGGLSTPPPLPGSVGRRPVDPLNLALLRDLPSLDVQARHLVEGLLSGRHRSPFKGSSVEFAEYRDYQFGDDLRRVDWRLYGRTDRLHVKQFEEETQMRIFLVLDVSASMQFRSPRSAFSKIEMARLVLAATGLLARRQQDAYGLAIVGQGLDDFLKARSSASHWRTFLGRLDGITVGGTTRLAATLEDLADLLPRRSMVLVASDFYEDGPVLEAALSRLRYDHHDVIGLHLMDPLEVDLGDDLHGHFVDIESGEQLTLETPAVREAYVKRYQDFCDGLDRTFGLMGGERVPIRTDEMPWRALAAFWARRKARR